MKYFLTDMHTHSYPASHDAQCSMEEMLSTAQSLGVDFYGLSEHFDYDYNRSLITEEQRAYATNGNTEEYFHRARHLQEDYEGVMNVAVGAEFGFSEDKEVQGRYAATYEKHRPDFVINSVHSGGGVDFFFQTFTQDKESVYREYLRLIRASLDVPYPYDIVGHIGYIARYVPYKNRDLTTEEFGEEIDDILKTVIQKDKILEVNSSTKNLPWLAIPDGNILKRYYELGGRKISFGSDSHGKDRILDKREVIVKALKEIGFTYVTVPFKGEHIKVEI